ncbi:uncharacterized protein KY384_008153 [Bacidia gigantensis]|uniref:uncharacterized protein n=1 Tax=Bacidia gigantensis TaxID=2732470 RepID=UPI001D050636|nr:uncharacterized protein KY384_008153 [Bacidia gigantensis]KAG8526724.1 hypothetical protein KY384_008153 [Bacidia gigantensis]
MEDPRNGSQPGTHVSGQSMRTQYHDPVSVRRWAASSAAGWDPSFHFPAGHYGDDNMPLVPSTEDSMQTTTHLNVLQSHVQTSYGCDQLSSLEFVESDSAPNGIHYIPQHYSNALNGLDMDAPHVANGSYEHANVYIENGAAFPTPPTDDLSLFEPIGAPAMCRQASSQGFPDYSTEWSSQDSPPGSESVPITQGYPNMQSVCMSPTSNVGSLPSHSHMDTPLSMAILDDANWQMIDGHGPGANEGLLPVPSENLQLPPTTYPCDQSTIKAHEAMSRPRIPDMDYWQQMHTEMPYPNYMGAQYNLSSSSRRPSDGEPTVTARKHPLYQAQPRSDGLYHCPHEREAHGLHGHGEKPFACYFPDCERAQPGQGFPRSWNLRDHMRRVHNYVIPGNSPSNDYPSPASSPETNLPIRRKKSPEVSASAGVKKSKTGNSAKPSKKESNHSHLESKRDEYLSLKAYIDRTYASLDPMDAAATERYHGDQVKLMAISKELRKKNAS